MKHVAYCWRSGEIGISSTDEVMPEGVIVFAFCDDRARLEDRVSARARHAYDGETLLVPGLPETEDDDALEVLNRWRDRAFQDFDSGMTPDLARAMFPLGAAVRYFPVSGRTSFVRASIRSEPWELGDGSVVIKITGQSGGVSIYHLVRDV